MGLINWFKDKVILNLEHDMKLLQAEIKGINMELEQLRGQIISVRQSRYKKPKEEDDEGDTLKELAQLKEMFGGSLPIELAEKYKNNGKP